MKSTCCRPNNQDFVNPKHPVLLRSQGNSFSITTCTSHTICLAPSQAHPPAASLQLPEPLSLSFLPELPHHTAPHKPLTT